MKKLILALIIATTFVSCSKDDDFDQVAANQELIGTWSTKSSTQTHYKTFTSRFRYYASFIAGNMNSPAYIYEDVPYSINSDGTITVQFESGSRQFRYEVVGDKLLWDGTEYTRN